MRPFVARHGDLAGVALSHRGHRRVANEDRWICDPERGRFAVVDGMGGQRAGARAAALATAAISEPQDLALAFVDANARIFEAAAGDPDMAGMGCVATAADLGAAGLVLAHVGDTRAYRVGEGACVQLTRDHTRAAERVRAGEAGQAGDGSNIVTRDLGGSERSGTDWIDRVESPFEPGDLLLLCSDGLSDVVPAAALFEMLLEARRGVEALDRLARQLVVAALEHGGRDNVTVVIARRDRGGAAPPDPGRRGCAGAALVLVSACALALRWLVSP